MPAAGQEAGQGAFPVTIAHKYGSTEIVEEPQRVVTVGRIEQDAVLALGVIPVATTERFGEYPGAIFPWAKEALGDAPLPEVLQPSYSAGGIPFERVAALRPDLILALYSDITERDYDTLARIAPTIAQPGEYGDLGISWQDLTRTVGVALGRADDAQRLLAGVEAEFAQARADHPEFTGATALNVYSAGDGAYQAYPPPDLGGRLLADLGFAVPAAIDELAGGELRRDQRRAARPVRHRRPQRRDLLPNRAQPALPPGRAGPDARRRHRRRPSHRGDPMTLALDQLTG